VLYPRGESQELDQSQVPLTIKGGVIVSSVKVEARGGARSRVVISQTPSLVKVVDESPLAGPPSYVGEAWSDMEMYGRRCWVGRY
jgi:hypothetical protein